MPSTFMIVAGMVSALLGELKGVEVTSAPIGPGLRLLLHDNCAARSAERASIFSSCAEWQGIRDHLIRKESALQSKESNTVYGRVPKGGLYGPPINRLLGSVPSTLEPL